MEVWCVLHARNLCICPPHRALIVHLEVQPGRFFFYQRSRLRKAKDSAARATLTEKSNRGRAIKNSRSAAERGPDMSRAGVKRRPKGNGSRRPGDLGAFSRGTRPIHPQDRRQEQDNAPRLKSESGTRDSGSLRKVRPIIMIAGSNDRQFPGEIILSPARRAEAS